MSTFGGVDQELKQISIVTDIDKTYNEKILDGIDTENLYHFI